VFGNAKHTITRDHFEGELVELLAMLGWHFSQAVKKGKAEDLL